jgi:serine/threonine protein kinase
VRAFAGCEVSVNGSLLQRSSSAGGGNCLVDFPTATVPALSLTSGKWYYEARVIAPGDCPQLGWCDDAFSPNHLHISTRGANGVGDDAHGWGIDGVRVKKWHKSDATYGLRWKPGDVVGFAVDLDAKVVAFSLNGSWATPMGRAFQHIAVTGGLRPALTLGRNVILDVNFGPTSFLTRRGERKFVHAPPSQDYAAVAMAEKVAAKVAAAKAAETAAKAAGTAAFAAETAAFAVEVSATRLHLATVAKAAKDQREKEEKEATDKAAAEKAAFFEAADRRRWKDAEEKRWVEAVEQEKEEAAAEKAKKEKAAVEKAAAAERVAAAEKAAGLQKQMEVMEAQIKAERVAHARALAQAKETARAEAETLARSVAEKAKQAAEEAVSNAAAKAAEVAAAAAAPSMWLDEVNFKDITILGRLGGGTFATVYEVQCAGQRMAFKCFHMGSEAERKGIVKLLLREARSLQECQHDNIIRLLGVCADDPAHTGLLTELAERGTLRDVIDEAKAARGDGGGSGLHPVEQFRLAHGIAAGIDALHSSAIVHRDLKTANILVSQGGAPKIADFGMATGKSGMTATQRTSAGGGTSAYLAPELVFMSDSDSDIDSDSGSEENGDAAATLPMTAASDIYALGLVFYALATGKEPWMQLNKKYPDQALFQPRVTKRLNKGERPPLPSSGVPGAHPFIIEVMEWCWKQEPGERPTAAALLGSFEREVDREREEAERERDAHTAELLRESERLTAIASIARQQGVVVAQEATAKAATNALHVTRLAVNAVRAATALGSASEGESHEGGDGAGGGDEGVEQRARRLEQDASAELGWDLDDAAAPPSAPEFAFLAAGCWNDDIIDATGIDPELALLAQQTLRLK